MAFVKKTWKDRIAEFPTRRRLTKSNGDSELVTVAREEGTLSQEGDAFSAENMNDLESRVDNAISEINSNLSELLNCKNEEQIIGTLFGKTLYRRVLFIEKEDKSVITGNGSFDLTSLFNFNLGDVDILKNMYMCGYKRGTQAYMLGNSNNNSNNNYSNMAAIWINPSGHSMLNYTFGEYFISTNYIVITLEYTKL